MEKYLPVHSTILPIHSDQPQKTQQFPPVAETFLSYCYNYISDNIDGDLSVGYLATKMCVSKSTLNRRLVMFTGFSANEIIRRRRLEKAAELLVAGKNVCEAAYMSGFETPSYFIHCFRAAFKQTPKKYAQNNSAFRQEKNYDTHLSKLQMKIA